MSGGGTLRQQLAWARRRLERAHKAANKARTTAVAEEYRIRLLEGHLAAGPGHAWTPDPELPTYEWDKPPIPRCRHCWGYLGDQRSAEACPGDRNQCPHLLAAADADWPEAEPAYKDPEGMVRCFRHGRFDQGFTRWICVGGHVVAVGDPTHSAAPPPLSSPWNADYPCRGVHCPHDYFVWRSRKAVDAPWLTSGR